MGCILVTQSPVIHITHIHYKLLKIKHLSIHDHRKAFYISKEKLLSLEYKSNPTLRFMDGKEKRRIEGKKTYKR